MRFLADQKQKKETKSLKHLLPIFSYLDQIIKLELAKKLADDVAAGGEFQVDDLTNSLRDDLRRQIGLKPVKGNVKWLRFKDNTCQHYAADKPSNHKLER